MGGESSVEEGWVDEVDAKGRPRAAGDAPGDIELRAEGIVWRSRGKTVRAPWEAIFGVFVLGEGRDAPELFVLLPRRPPMPPWLRVDAEGVPAELGDVDALATALRTRTRQRGYREVGAHRARLSSEELLEEVLARREVPGALEVPVGPGPGGVVPRWRRIGRGMAGGAGLGVGLTVLLISVPAMLPLLIVAGATGAIAGGFFTSGRARLRLGRGRLPRVLVLAPDGAVVGLPSGVRAFAWSAIGHFEAEEYEATAMGQPAETRSCLSVADAEGKVLGRIDADWFAEPLPLILAVAEAYRERVAAGARS